MWTVSTSVLDSLPELKRSQSTKAPCSVTVAEVLPIAAPFEQGPQQPQRLRVVVQVEVVLGHDRFLRAGAASDSSSSSVLTSSEREIPHSLARSSNTSSSSWERYTTN